MASKMGAIRKAMDEQLVTAIKHQRRAEAGDPEYLKGQPPSRQPKLSQINKNCKIVTLGKHVSTNSEVIRVYVQNDGSRSQQNSHKSTGKQWILMKVSNIVAIRPNPQKTWKVSDLPTNWKGESDKHINVTKSVANNDQQATETALGKNREKILAKSKRGKHTAKELKKQKTQSVIEKLTAKFRAERVGSLK